ncbi:MAG: hypothetical protein EP343_14830 [Deltaproteobacteria bacterium]|nr:MAG: hypothetical protein EP343_14830 [Deltaproteobacteria bacterium]
MHPLRWAHGLLFSFLFVSSCLVLHCSPPPCQRDSECGASRTCQANVCRVDRCTSIQLQEKLLWELERVPGKAYVLQVTVTLQDSNLTW